MKIAVTTEEIEKINWFSSEALHSSSACNLGAVVHSFNRWITFAQVYTHKHGGGTDWINNHPITTVFVQTLDNINHGASDGIKFGDAVNTLIDAVGEK